MGISESRRRANNKWLNEKVENITFRVPKGEKARIAAHAKLRGESTNAFIYRAVNETIERENSSSD